MIKIKKNGEWKIISGNKSSSGSGSQEGDIIASTSLDTEAKVIERYGGSSWELLGDEDGVYQWLRGPSSHTN